MSTRRTILPQPSRRELRHLATLTLACSLILNACDTAPFGHGVPPETGGRSSTPASGGSDEAGAAGSDAGSGGESSSLGGTSSDGGTTAIGGTTAAGGTTAIGGTLSMGGSSSTGGTTAVGGTSSKGGTTAAGGTSSKGGTSSTGGTTAAGCAPSTVPTTMPQYQMEALDRGLVAVAVPTGVYLGWRMLGTEYDALAPSRVSYNVYRDGTQVASVTNSTNYLDTAGTPAATYAVAAVIDTAELTASPAVTVWAQNYLTIPLQLPAGGTTDRATTTQTDAAYTYAAGDGSTGDLDGDGKLDIVLKWDPSNLRDNGETAGGFTGNVLIDAYKLDGTFLWRIDLGRNIRAGAHYTQFVVYDFDGDGKAELAVKTAPGTKDGTGAYLHLGPAATDNDSADYRSDGGWILTGPEYLTVFSGTTGAELATVNYEVGRGNVSDWGDSYGNRVDRFLASAGFLSDTGVGQNASGRPSILMGRGYYVKSTVSAWNYRSGALSKLWAYDSSVPAALSAVGQGAHHMAVADADVDGAQEIIYGAATIDSNGCVKCSTGKGHGDSLHVADLVPSRPGLEVFMPHEGASAITFDVRDASTCEAIVPGVSRGLDTGRGVAGDISPTNPGAEVWASGSTLVSATTGESLGAAPSPINFLVWWDADESRELLDGTTISKYGAGTLLTAAGCASNNGTKATPVLVADMLGDWREEVIWRKADNTALVLYTTTDVTSRRIHTLMHDAQYRMHITSQQTAYNQPPHPSFHIGNGMIEPPTPSIVVK